MANGAGAGYNVPDIDKTIADFAQLCVRVKYQGTDLRAWLDRINAGTVAEAAAALVLACGADNLTLDKATKQVEAIREMTFWAMSFVPTHTLDVRGPSSLI